MVAVTGKDAPCGMDTGPLAAVMMKSGLLPTPIWLPARALLFSSNSATVLEGSAMDPSQNALLPLFEVALPVSVAHAPGASDGGAASVPTSVSAVVMFASV